ncbi:MAG: cytochrome c family protein [Deltaproteobacteria bacterium]|nr:cytochrome c family protein [Deltaproteobacteria bacterium]
MNKRMRPSGFGIAGFVLAALAAGFVLMQVTAVPAAEKLTRDQIHGIHLKDDVGLECPVCHVDKSDDAGVMRFTPRETTCKECHDDPKELGFVEGKVVRRGILFDHKTHIADMDKTCQECHQETDKTRVQLPSHKNCVECHQEDLDKMLCGKCHIDLAAIGLKALSSYSHKADFMSRHDEYARNSMKSCAQCHTESFCLDCHNKHESLKPSLKYPEKTTANLIHRGDWETAHRFEARTDPASCLRCHGVNACNTCHAERGVGARADATALDHPAGWMTKGSGDFHGDKARAEIVTCASCHDRGGPGDCRTCHRESSGLNPHPQGWDPKNMTKKDRMCAECHSR